MMGFLDEVVEVLLYCRAPPERPGRGLPHRNKRGGGRALMRRLSGSWWMLSLRRIVCRSSSFNNTILRPHPFPTNTISTTHTLFCLPRVSDLMIHHPLC